MVDFAGIIDRIYDSVTKPLAWPETLHFIRGEVGAAYAGLAAECGLAAPNVSPPSSPTEGQRQLARQLVPHLKRALHLSGEAGRLRPGADLHVHVFDALSWAVFVLGPARKLRLTNAAGRAALRSGEWVLLPCGILNAPCAASHRHAFENAVDLALTGGTAHAAPGKAVPLVTRTGETSAAYIIPIFGAEAGPSCAVFVATHGCHSSLVEEALRAGFGMTKSEAHVALLTSRGFSPTDIAKMLGVSIHTVRTHLKHSFAKTSAADRTALAALVHGLTPPAGPASLIQMGDDAAPISRLAFGPRGEQQEKAHVLSALAP